METRLLNPLKRRIMNMVARAKVTAVDISKKLPKLRVSMLDGEDSTNIEYFQQYGFASVPKEGGEAIIIFIGGNRDHGIALSVEEREKRLADLEKGEVAIYHPEKQSYVKLLNDGSIESFSAEGESYVRQLVDGTIEFENSSVVLSLGDDGLVEIDNGSGLLQLKANGGLHYEGTKVALKNASDDLVALLVDTLTALTAVTVNTAVGPQPFVNLADFTALKTKVQAFKE